MQRSHQFARLSLAAGGLVAAQAAIAWVLPPVGAVFFLTTLTVLEEVESRGFPVLGGSPEGWPIPTGFGWWVAALGWWACWTTLLVAFKLFRASRFRKMAQMSNPEKE